MRSMKSDYTIRELTAEEFIPHFEEHRAKVFEDIHNYRTDQLFSEAEHEEISLLNTRMGDPFKLHLGAFDKDDNFVGWSWGPSCLVRIFLGCPRAPFERF